MTGKELHAMMLQIQAERGLEGTSWEEESEMGGNSDWDQLAEKLDERQHELEGEREETDNMGDGS